MPVKLSSTGGGSVTLDTPSTASNYTVTLPSTSGTLATTSGTGSVFTNPTINGFTGDTSVVNIGSGQFYKDTSGNVGIGTSSPGAASGYTTLDVSNATNGARVRCLVGSTAYGGMYTNGTTDFRIGSLAAVPLNIITGSNTIATFDTSGNLGLGLSPSAWHSNFKALQTGNNYAAFVGDGSNGYAEVLNNCYASGASTYNYYATLAATRYSQQLGSHKWYIAGAGSGGSAISWTQAMTLDASGNLLVGVTSSTATPAKGFVATSSGNAQIAVGHDTGALSGYYYASFAYNGSAIGSITQNGTTAVAYNTSSDQRLKTNITPAGSAIQSILDFPVDQFDWISSGEHQDFGAVAQKAINVIPEMVSVPADPDEMWGIDWSKAVPRLIKTIQELSAKNSELESRLAALEGK